MTEWGDQTDKTGRRDKKGPGTFEVAGTNREKTDGNFSWMGSFAKQPKKGGGHNRGARCSMFEAGPEQWKSKNQLCAGLTGTAQKERVARKLRQENADLSCEANTQNAKKKASLSIPRRATAPPERDLCCK